MKLFIVGPRWAGEWTEAVGRAAVALGCRTATFYYRTDTLGGLKGMAKQQLHPSIQKIMRWGAQKVRSSKDILMNRRLITAVRAFQPDIILILKGETIYPETLVTLRKEKVPLVSWWVDDPFCFPDLLESFNLFDMLYMFDREGVTKLEAEGVKHIMYLPCACDQTTYHPQSLNPRDYPDLDCTIGFVAMYHPMRAALLGQMKGWDVGLWGSDWELAQELHELPPNTWRGPQISTANAAKVYNLAKICPNVHHPQTRFGGLNTRAFEIPAAGAFELIDYVPGLEEHFDVGREIVAYTSPAQFRELAKYYLAHPDERAAIAERGRARVLRDHTYGRRIETILKTLGRPCP